MRSQLMEENTDVIEKVLADTNRKDVTLIADGLTKQHFIELDPFSKARGDLYESQIKQIQWSPDPDKPEEPEKPDIFASESADEANDLFSTELNDKMLMEARSRLASRLSGFTGASVSSVSRQLRASLVDNISMRAASFVGVLAYKNSREPTLPKWYLNETAQKIKEEVSNRGNEYYEISLAAFNEGDYEKTLLYLNKAFLFNSLNIQFYLLKFEALIKIEDFKGALLTMNKLMAILALYTDDNDISYDDLRRNVLERTVFCFKSMAQSCFDSGRYLDAYESYLKAAELEPENFEFRVKSILCLCEMDRATDAIRILDELINTDESSKRDEKLYVLRAEVNIKENNMSKAYFDLKEALRLNPDYQEAKRMIAELKENAERFRNNGLIMGLNNRLLDGIIKMTQAIEYDPEIAEYHLQRGILYKRRRDFNSAIDDFLLGIEKLNKENSIDKQLLANFHRQVLLTYNDFAIQCYEKGFYDDAIVLLNKALKSEKSEKGFYVNRGDCFYRKNEKEFALLDYEQAHEIDPKDQEIKNRIAKINFEFGIESYNEKEYQKATKYFDLAIKFAPNVCKYYLSRARTLFLSDEKLKAQVDICVAILLDPSNTEIPTIISRIFVNNDLNEVMGSDQMKFAKEYLEALSIPSVFDLSKIQEENRRKEMIKKRDRPNRLQPSLKESLKEEQEILKIVEEKKNLKNMITNVENLKIQEPARPKLKPLEEKSDYLKRARSKEINWRRFKSGIGSSL